MKERKPFFGRSEIISLIVWIIVCVCFFMVLFKFIIMPGYVASSSMAPTIQPGEHFILNGLAYIGDKAPKRGDIISFRSDEFDCDMIKRVIGLPGDVVTFQEGNVYINGIVYDETEYLADGVETICNNTFIVPDDLYFFLGDNREDSLDSRFWKNPYISEEKFNGKVIFIY